MSCVVIALGAAYYALKGEAVGEEIGGSLTGPFSFANTVGVIVFIAAAAFAVFNPRWTACAAIIGVVLTLPMQSWRLFPGLWCLIGNCSVYYPLIEWNSDSVSALISFLNLLSMAILLRRPTP